MACFVVGSAYLLSLGGSGSMLAKMVHRLMQPNAWGCQ
jgi:hypothetical protein